MRILIDLINFPASGGDKYDWRYTMWTAIGMELIRRGHTVHAVWQNGVENCPIPRYEIDKLYDFYICHTPYGNSDREKRREKHLNAGKPVSCYDHGWLPHSLVVDRKKLFGDSYYYNTIRTLIKECPDTAPVETMRLRMLHGNISKRSQDRIDKVPDVPFVFIPGQVLKDASVVYYSKIGMKQMIERTAKYVTANGLHVVYKPHPGTLSLRSHGKEELRKLAESIRKTNKKFHICNTSIFDLMQKAKFTACINSGSIIDNIVSQTPVYCCGKSFFADSGAVHYNPNLEKGLGEMMKGEYDWAQMKRQQIRMLWWLKENLIQQDQPMSKQIELLSKHSGVVL